MYKLCRYTLSGSMKPLCSKVFEVSEVVRSNKVDVTIIHKLIH